MRLERRSGGGEGSSFHIYLKSYYFRYQIISKNFQEFSENFAISSKSLIYYEQGNLEVTMGAYSGICPEGREGGWFFLFSRGVGLIFPYRRGGAAPVGTWKPHRNLRFFWSRGVWGWTPITSTLISPRLEVFKWNTGILKQWRHQWFIEILLQRNQWFWKSIN